MLKLRESAPKSSIARGPRRQSKRGQHRRDRHGEGASARPGSRSGAKAREGSPGDLRDPICVHLKQPELRAAGNQTARAGREAPTHPERYGEHETGGSCGRRKRTK